MSSIGPTQGPSSTQATGGATHASSPLPGEGPTKTLFQRFCDFITGRAGKEKECAVLKAQYNTLSTKIEQAKGSQATANQTIVQAFSKESLKDPVAAGRKFKEGSQQVRGAGLSLQSLEQEQGKVKAKLDQKHPGWDKSPPVAQRLATPQSPAGAPSAGPARKTETTWQPAKTREGAFAQMRELKNEMNRLGGYMQDITKGKPWYELSDHDRNACDEYTRTIEVLKERDQLVRQQWSL
jgi:hypothetical protein